MLIDTEATADKALSGALGKQRSAAFNWEILSFIHIVKALER